LEKLGSNADQLISKIFPFDEAEQALPFWDGDRNVLKIIIERN